MPCACEVTSYKKRTKVKVNLLLQRITTAVFADIVYACLTVHYGFKSCQILSVKGIMCSVLREAL